MDLAIVARRWTCWCMLCGAREVDLGESLSPEFPRAGDGEAFECRFLPMGIAEVFLAAIYAASEETLDLCDRTMTVLSVPFSLLGASFWSECWLDGTSGGAVSHPPQGRRRILEAWNYGGAATGRVWMDTCRMVELFGVVVVSTTGQVRSMGQFLL